MKKPKTTKRIKKQEDKVEYANLKRKVAALWTRVSTERQEVTNCSLETQKKICYDYAKKNGIIIKREFGGTHESAKTQGNKFNEMIASVAYDKEINVILVYSFDRFSRSGPEGLVTKAFLRSKGIFVISATQQIDPDSAAGIFMESIIFLFNSCFASSTCVVYKGL